MTLFSKGASYERISKADEGDEDGVIRQGEDTAELAERRGIPLQGRRFRDNDKSATHGKHRPQYELLMAAVQRGEVDVIIVYMLGRLWRNRRERAEGIEILRKHEVSVLCVKGPELDLTTAAGRLLAGLLGEVDTFEVEQMSEREQREMRQRVERGLPPTGPRCFGYTADGAELVEDEAAEVKNCFHALLAGATLSGMAADLNERGILNRNGKPWSHNAIRGVLLNERYAGLRQYRGELHPGEWPVIVDEATWRAAKHVLEDESRRTSPGPGRRWLLSGVARCGVCDDGTTVTSGSRGGPKGTRGLTTPLYRCRTTKHLARGTEPIDLTVEEYVIRRLSRPDAVDFLVDETAPRTEELRARAVALRSRIRVLTDEFADDDDADAAEFKAATRRIKARLADVEAQMAHPQRARILVDIVTAEDPAKAWKDLTLDRQRAVVETLATVTLLPGRPGRAPFDPRSVRIEPLQGMG
ncbi:recombinase family protein [Streptomyces sp. TRM49041]|uniref:recombinase family protein n=1 Tax=Streptomyces sp. TRM49041 TaxID=2603216 RepID=UPI0011EEC680|nr:recombinase family protein [Streptomyces sp. TRM49041]